MLDWTGLRDLTVWAILAREVDPPDGVEPVEWMLLTTMGVTTFEQAVEKLAWYTVRWQIEVYHRTLKSGCKIEDRQLGNADRIEACLAIDMVVAWRIVHLTRLGRETPDVTGLGGFLGRKSDGEPGTQTLWIGLQRLDDLTAMYKVMTATNVPHPKKCAVSNKPEYG